MRRVAALALGAMLAAAACSGDAGGPVPTPTKPGALPASLTTVTVTDFRFQPRSLQVPVGTRVTWTFRGQAEHQVAGNFNGAEVASGVMRTGNFEHEFTEPGTFSYRCGVHGDAMSGLVTVR